MTSRVLLAALAVALIPALSACKSDEPTKVATAVPADQYPYGGEGVAVGGPPNQEIASDYYKTLTGWAVDYPKLRPEIVRDFKSDGYITYAEYDQISRDQEKMTQREGERKWDSYIISYRNALMKAAKS